MRRTILLVVAAVALMLTMVSPAAATVQYPDVTFPSNLMQYVEPGFWDLTEGPVIIQYTLDLSAAPDINITNNWDHMGMVGLFSGWGTAAQAGARMVGFQYDWDKNAPDKAEPKLDNDDKLNLQRWPNPAPYDETLYDTQCSTGIVVSPPIGSGLNHGIWFDRDGVDQWQDDMWGMLDGDTYNTEGVYDVTLTFEAGTLAYSDKGFVCARVNGRSTGFYTSWWDGPPQYYDYGLSFTATEAQMRGMRVVVEGASDGGAIVVSDLTVSGHQLFYGFDGFFAPIDNSMVNTAKAGQAVPVKWHLTGFDGAPVSDPASFATLTSIQVGCDDFTGDPPDAIEEYATGSSGLQYLGDGFWQFNWKTPKGYAGQCRIMTLTLNDGSTHTAEFQFK